MALGGGTWGAQDKVLPGAYMNFSSGALSSDVLSERGYVAIPLIMNWGPSDEVFTVTSEEFQSDCLSLFCIEYADDSLLPLREVFKNASTLYGYRLNGGGAKASNTFCIAKYPGTAGNSLSTVIVKNVDDESLFEVSIYFNTTLVDTQTVSTASELVSNDYADFIAEAELEETVKTPLEGGINGEVTIASYQAFLDKVESYSYNILACPTNDVDITNLFVNYTKRMRDEVGAKFQTVIYSSDSKIADYEGVIEVGSKVINYDAAIGGLGEYGLVYWVAGAEAGCSVNASTTNKEYDGELEVDTDYTQTDLENFIVGSKFVLHTVNGSVRVLEDLSSLTTLTSEKTELFQSNQNIRVCDQIGNDVALLFSSKYLGTMPNDKAGRISLWNDVCDILKALESLSAIEYFNTKNVQIEQGETKKAVVCKITELSIVNAMAQLYMSVVIC